MSDKDEQMALHMQGATDEQVYAATRVPDKRCACDALRPWLWHLVFGLLLAGMSGALWKW